MRIDILLWAVVPSLVALLAIAGAWGAVRRRPGPLGALLAVVVTVFGAAAAAVAVSIFVRQCYPTFLPHVVIGTSNDEFAFGIFCANEATRNDRRFEVGVVAVRRFSRWSEGGTGRSAGADRRHLDPGAGPRGEPARGARYG